MTAVSVKCAEFQGNISAGLLSMLETEQYANVTIAVEGQYLKAHQMVLSICSPYFNSLLQSAPCKHPIIFIKGVKYNVMKHLLRFIYEGEIQIAADVLQSFIETARELQIKWLTEVSKNSANASRADRPAERSRRSSTPEPNMEQLDIQAISQSLMNSYSDATVTDIKLEVEDQEDDMNTDCELVENTNGNIDTTIAESFTDTDTDSCFVDPIDTTLHDPAEMNYDNISLNDEKPEVLVEGINFHDKNKDKLLQPVYRPPQPSIPATRSQPGEPVKVLFYKAGKSKKIAVNKYFYCRRGVSKSWSTWRCLKAFTGGCAAKVCLTDDNHILFSKPHNHKPEGKVFPRQRGKLEIYHHTDQLSKKNFRRKWFDDAQVTDRVQEV